MMKSRPWADIRVKQSEISKGSLKFAEKTCKGNKLISHIVITLFYLLFYEKNRRQFNLELESRSIKLIFNGQILDDDTKSLTQCGLFSDAVVHCLILQKRNVATSTDSSNIVTRQRARGSTSLLSSIQYVEWISMLFVLIVTLTLMFCWWCRYGVMKYFWRWIIV